MKIKGIPVPITFALVVVVAIGLTIFFGAWAASVDPSSQSNTTFAAIAGSNSQLANAERSFYIPARGDNLSSGATRISSSEQLTGKSKPAAWQRTLLVLCPLH